MAKVINVAKTTSRRRRIGRMLVVVNFAFWAAWVEIQSLQFRFTSRPFPLMNVGPYFWDFPSWIIPGIVSSGLLAATYFYATEKRGNTVARIVLFLFFLFSYLCSALYLAGCFSVFITV